jgi:hypothetical protein
MSGLKVFTDTGTGRSRVQASVVALIHNSKGEVVHRISREVARELPKSELAEFERGRILYSEPVELPAGEYEMDAAVTDEQASRSSVRRSTAKVDSGSNLAVSSLEVVNRLEPLAGTRNPQNPFELDNVRVLPTLAESVASDKPVAVYFVVYPSSAAPGADPKVTLELFQDGKEVARKPLSLPKPEADGSIPMMVQVSPGLGQCDIRITARQGTLVARSERLLTIQ